MENNKSSISRRRIVQGIGAAGIGGLAGCAGTDPEGNGGGDTTEFVATTWEVPEDSHFNYFATTEVAEDANNVLFDTLAKYNYETDEFIPILASDWTLEDNIFELHLSEDHSWHNGEPVTATDLVTQLRIDRHLGGTIWDFLESVEAVDDSVVEFEIAAGTTESIIYNTLFDPYYRINTPAEIFGEYLERIEDASTEDEENDALNELMEFRLEEPIGNGPMELIDRNEQDYIFEPYDDYPTADSINFDRYVLRYTSADNVRWTGLTEGEFDGSNDVYMPSEQIENLPDHVYMNTLPAHTGSGITFHHNDDFFGDRLVRQAIAHIIDREEVSHTIYEPIDTAIDVPCGIPPSIQDEWVSDVLDDFTQYERDEERAASLLEEAGYERDGDTWVDEDGEPVEKEIPLDGNSDNQIVGYQHAASNLQDFGLDINVVPIEGTQYWGQVYPNGDFPATQVYWGAAVPHPFFTFRENDTTLGTGTDGDVSDIPSEFSVPMPVGDPDGSMETIDVASRVQELSRSSGEEAREICRELAWVHNQVLPCLEIVEKDVQSFVATDEWDVPDEGDAAWGSKFPPYWLLRQGHLQAAE